jgi:DNA-binding transcriptional regulator YhcF (GntR family)
MTVQKAYDELAREELVIPRRGKGYIVAALQSSERSSLAKAHVKEKFRESVEAAFVDGLSGTAILAIVKELVLEKSLSIGGDSHANGTKA